MSLPTGTSHSQLGPNHPFSECLRVLDYAKAGFFGLARHREECRNQSDCASLARGSRWAQAGSPLEYDACMETRCGIKGR